MRVAIITDSGGTSVTSKQTHEGIYSLPLQISDKEKVFLEGETTTNAEIYDLIEQKHILKTSLPPLGRIEELFLNLAQEYDLLFAIPITSGLSSTLETMISVAKQHELNFDYFDCYSTCGIQYELAVAAKKLFDKGYDVTEVKKRLQESEANSNTLILPLDLKHLSRGGRLTGLAATLGGMLKIVPVLEVNKKTSGKIDSLAKTRTFNKALQKVVELFQEQGVGKNYKVYIAHVRNLEGAKKLQTMMQNTLKGVEYSMIELVTTVGVHTGLGCVATQYIKAINLD